MAQQPGHWQSIRTVRPKVKNKYKSNSILRDRDWTFVDLTFEQADDFDGSRFDAAQADCRVACLDVEGQFELGLTGTRP